MCDTCFQVVKALATAAAEAARSAFTAADAEDAAYTHSMLADLCSLLLVPASPQNRRCIYISCSVANCWACKLLRMGGEVRTGPCFECMSVLSTAAMPTLPACLQGRACLQRRIVLVQHLRGRCRGQQHWLLQLRRNAAAFDAASHPDPQADGAPQWLLQQEGASQLAALSGAAEAISNWWAAQQGREPSGTAGPPDSADVRYSGTSCW
jgi:hypothetical protein